MRKCLTYVMLYRWQEALKFESTIYNQPEVSNQGFDIQGQTGLLKHFLNIVLEKLCEEQQCTLQKKSQKW